MGDVDEAAAIATRYRRFADEEAKGRSPLYEDLCRRIADDTAIIGFLRTLPDAKRQPNLLLGAVRHLHGLQRDLSSFRQAVLGDPDGLRAFMQSHATQTNEPARCAVMLPVLARLKQGLSLIEVGASAGLCLLPDLYAYDYDGIRLGTANEPVLACKANQATPLPDRLPDVVYRAGLDLDPVDPADPAQAAWLESLVWPGQERRLAGLQAALRVAAQIRPKVTRGDLLGDALDTACAAAPQDSTRVVFHTAVLAYIPDPSARLAFSRKVARLCDYWIANEAPSVFPDIADKAGAGGVPEGPTGRFLLSVNGQPVAWTDPHGAFIDWFGPDPGSIRPYG